MVGPELPFWKGLFGGRLERLDVNRPTCCSDECVVGVELTIFDGNELANGLHTLLTI
jgi:hypothetical protein